MTEQYTGSCHDRFHARHNWRGEGLDLTCKKCFDEVFEYACQKLKRFGVPDVWQADVATLAIHLALFKFDPEYPTRSSAPFLSYLVTVLRNEALSQLRSEEARRARNARWATAQARLVAAFQLEEVIADIALVDDVMDSVERTWGRDRPELVDTCRYWLLGFDTDEIAELVQLSPRTVRRHRAFLEDWIQRRYASVLQAVY